MASDAAESDSGGSHPEEELHLDAGHIHRIRCRDGKGFKDLKFTASGQALSPVPKDGFREIAVNPDVILEKNSKNAFQYELNGKSTLKWFMNQHSIKKLKRNGKETGYMSDPNAMYSAPSEILACYEQLLHISMGTVKIVDAMPDPTK